MARADGLGFGRALRRKRARLKMILVTTGSNGTSFDRMLSVVERFSVAEEVVVQHGPSSIRPRDATCVDFLPFDRLNELVSKARIVVAHAGVGSILLCLTHRRTPIVVPRLARLGEAIDDHQLALARRLAESGLVTCVEDTDDLPQAIRMSRDSVVDTPHHDGGLELAADLRRYVDSLFP